MGKKTPPAPALEPAPEFVNVATLPEPEQAVKPAQPEASPASVQLPRLRLFDVTIAPCPRRRFEAATPEAAEALYRQLYQLLRRDLVVNIKEVFDDASASNSRPAVAASV